MHPVASRIDSFTAADLPKLEKPSPVVVAKSAPVDLMVRAAKAVMHRTTMKALALRAMPAAIELFLDGPAFPVTAATLQANQPALVSVKKAWLALLRYFGSPQLRLILEFQDDRERSALW